VPQTVSLWKVQVVWAGHHPFLSRNSCLQALHGHDACTGRFPRCNLTQHEDDGEERVPVEAQGTQQEHADAK